MRRARVCAPQELRATTRRIAGAPGCMSGAMDPECRAIFSKLGLDIATGESTGNPAFMRVANK